LLASSEIFETFEGIRPLSRPRSPLPARRPLVARRASRPVSDFTSGHIIDFGWSRDGKQLLLSKGEETSDVLFISKFR